MSRGTSSKLDAVFSMPGLEEIAAPLQRFGVHADDAVALLAYVAARPVLRSANALDDELSDPDVWSRLTRVAGSVGRSLPEAPPTFDKLRHLRDKIGDDIGEVLLEMEQAFTLEAFKLARLAGLAVPRDDWDLTTPIRANTLFADGTWWEPQSGVTIDPDTGEPLGSRTRGVRRSDDTWWTEPQRTVDPFTGEVTVLEPKQVQGPRVSEVWTTTKDGRQLRGVPFVIAGVHGDLPHQRVVLGMRRFQQPGLVGDGAETPAADELLQRVIAASDGGLRWCVYDMAFRGANLQRLARQGVVGIAAMPAAGTNQSALTVDPDDPGPVRYNNDGRKTRFSSGSVGHVRHRVGDRWCDHELSAVDGSLRTHRRDRPVSVNDPLCELRDLWFEQPRRGGQQMWALYVVPCEHGDVTKKIELTGKVPGTSILMLNRIRPIDEYVPMFAAIKGWRQDVENVNSIMKRGTPLHGQATSLSAAHFELDVLGSALWVNSTCWDIHVGAVSNSAKRRKRRNRKAALKAPSNL